MKNDKDALYLYHATDREHLESILQNGLVTNSPFCNWDRETCTGKVFLALDAIAAESYVEAQEDEPEDIVVLKINLEDLDKRFFGRDENNRCPLEDTNSCIYLQNIPPELLTECDVNLEPYQDLESFRGTELYQTLVGSNTLSKPKVNKKAQESPELL